MNDWGKTLDCEEAQKKKAYYLDLKNEHVSDGEKPQLASFG